MGTYKLYRKTDVSYLPQIPANWEVIRTRFVAKLYTGNSLNDKEKTIYSDTDEDCSYPYIASKDIESNTDFINYNNGIRIPFNKEEDFCIAPESTTLLCIEGGSAGKKMAFTEEKVCFVNKLCCFDSKLNQKFHYYYLKSLPFSDAFEQNIKGMIGGVSIGQLKDIYVPVPSINEQSAIVKYLDAKCTKIDDAIKSLEKKMDLLEEYKQGIITKYVTKGLKPNVKTKDSGIEWIGQIPEEWSLIDLKYITKKIGSGSTPKGGAEIYVDSGVAFLRSQNIHNDGLKLEDVAYITDDINNEMLGTQVKEGDVLYNITGASIGRCYIADSSLGPANVNQHVCIVRPKAFDSKYLMFFLQSQLGQIQLRLLLKGGNREGLAAEEFKEFIIIKPSDREQKDIVSFLEGKLENITLMIKKTENQIKLLKEYKQSLITEVVTGKRKVIKD